MPPPGAKPPSPPPVVKICPNCYKRIYLGECRIVSRVCPGVVLADRPEKWEIEIARIRPKPVTSPEYVRQLASRECYECKYLLPYSISQDKPTVNVAIIGDVGSGKSHYIAALLRHIQAGEVQSKKQYLNFTCLTPDVFERYRQQYIEPLFEQKQVLPPTPMQAEDSSPLIYEINIVPFSKRLSKTINLVLRDVSGTDYATRDKLEKYCRFVLHADAILYLVDPISLPGLHNRLSPSSYLNLISYTIGRTVLMDSILSFIRKLRDEESISSIPCAVILSKTDLLRHRYAFPELLGSSPNGCRRGVSLADMNWNDQEVKKYIFDNGSSSLIAAIEKFRQVHFFAISSTGYPSDENGVYPAIEPLHCPDPLLWVLDRLGIIKLE